MRGQLQGLFEAFLAGRITSVVVDAVNTLDPGQPASVSAQIMGNVLHLTLDLPRGADGVNGIAGTNGGSGPAGPQGPPFANALIGGVSTLNPGDSAAATVSFDGTNVTFFFAIPRGSDGFGGITPQQLDTAISGTSRNTNNVFILNQTPDAEYNPSQIQVIQNKIDELIQALRR
jgi:hypothetical protein